MNLLSDVPNSPIRGGRRRVGGAAGATCAALAALSVAGTAPAAPDIADIAPENSVLVMGADNAAQLRSAFEDAGFMQIWNDQEIRDWVMSLAEDGLDELEAGLDDMGFSLDDLRAPSGPVGMALYPRVVEGELEATTFQVIAMADFGADADVMHDLIIASINEAADESDIELVEEQFEDVTITIRPSEFDDDALGRPPFSDAMHYARSGSVLMFSNDMGGMERMIEMAGGADLLGAGDTPIFAESMEMLGQDRQAYLVFNVAPFIELTRMLDAQTREQAEEMANQGMGGMGMQQPEALPILAALGLDEVRGTAFGVRFDAAGSVAESTLAVLVPEKRGLMALMDLPAKALDAPSFVGADATSVGLVQFNFGGLVPLARSVIQALPDGMQNMAMQQLNQAAPQFEPLLSNLGPEIYTVQTIRRPFAADSQQMLGAIKAGDTQMLNGFIGGFGAMIGLQPQDFQGNQIWRMAGGGMGMAPGTPEIALSAAFGHLFIGSADAVENALRTAGDPDAARLADDPRFQAAAQDMPGTGLSFGWQDTRASLEYAKWQMENMEDMLREQFRAAYGNDPNAEEWIEEDVQAELEALPDALRNLPDLDPILEIMGDSITTFQVTPKGIVGKTKLLKPAD